MRVCVYAWAAAYQLQTRPRTGFGAGEMLVAADSLLADEAPERSSARERADRMREVDTRQLAAVRASDLRARGYIARLDVESKLTLLQPSDLT